MIKQVLALSVLFVCLWTSALAQPEDPVLFTVEDNPIHLSEFSYIYSKTNGEKADFSKSSLQEYLDLYVKFKLKVQRAKDMRLDTIPSLIRELDGYRRQLANSYLVDKEVTDRLVREAYDRTLKDVDISHIMINLPTNATPKDTLAAYQKVMEAQKMLQSGKAFEEVAKEMSQDKGTKNNGGRIGFITALLPNGFYSLENAVYNTAVGQVAAPIRTTAGYHIVKVNGEREARGEVEIAHILIRSEAKKGNAQNAKATIDSLYQVLNKGGDFADMAKGLSEDKLSAPKGGNIGFFGINRYERGFEDAAFGLKQDGDISAPVQTRAGWHILKRISRKPIEGFDISKRRLQPKIQKDGRYELAKQAMINRIKKESNYQEKTAALDKYFGGLDKEFLSAKWRPSTDKSTEALFSLGGDTNFSVAEFEAFCQRSSRKRVREGRNSTPAGMARILFEDFVGESCIKYEESQLENKYPEFKALMREYQEGILLFEATKNLVWDKASQDSVGLVRFHENNRDNYMWGERAKVSTYTLKADGKKRLKKIRKCAAKDGPDQVIKRFNKKNKYLAVQEKVVEKGKDEKLANLTWKTGEMTATETNPNNKSLKFTKIEEVIPPTQKTMKEARGYIIADYQDYLEKEWLKELENSYKVNVNQKVFNSLVK
ncbi:MAG: peptidylprolyl isomerase [Bacteroidota bacterium]